MAYTVATFNLKSGYFTYRRCASLCKKPCPRDVIL